MIIITGIIKVVSKDELDRVKETLVRRAQRSRKDTGNIEYAFSVNLEDPTELRLIEKWENATALKAHLENSDEEFDAILATAQIEMASITSNEVTHESVLMER